MFNKKLQSGVTLIELMVVVAILAILASLAAPSFNQLIANNRQSSQVNSLLGDMRFARSEAIKRGRSIALCPSSDPTSATAACSGNDWRTGWILFVDEDNNSARASTEAILRRQESISAQSGGIVTNGSNPVSAFRFNGEGRIPGAQDNLKFISTLSGIDDRLLCVNTTGRVRVLAKGVSTC